MAVTIYYENDVDPKIIQGKKVAIIGYGSQGHAHALNLMDSGVDVRVGLREGSKSWAKAEEAGLKVTTMDQAAEEADVVMILVPDELQPEVYEQHIASHLKAGDTLAFARDEAEVGPASRLDLGSLLDTLVADMVDAGAPGNERIMEGAPKLVRIDLASNRVTKVIPVPEEVALLSSAR